MVFINFIKNNLLILKMIEPINMNIDMNMTMNMDKQDILNHHYT